jgi:Flp pilus assembly protein TadG
MSVLLRLLRWQTPAATPALILGTAAVAAAKAMATMASAPMAPMAVKVAAAAGAAMAAMAAMVPMALKVVPKVAPKANKGHSYMLRGLSMRSFKSLLMRFISGESGNVIILFTAALVMLVTAVGGALDLSRYLIARTQAQAALDNAVLSAAAVSGQQDVTLVANRFFTANSPSSVANFDPVDITQTPPDADRGALITGRVEGRVEAFFGSFIGVDRYEMSLLSETEIAAAPEGIEVVLTLDISGSMCQTTPLGGPVVPEPTCRKLNALKLGARSFVDQMFADHPDIVRVGLVPFDHHVRTPNNLPAVFGSIVMRTGGLFPNPTANTLALSEDLNLLRNRIAALDLLPDPNGTVPGQRRGGWTRVNIGALTAGLMLMPYPQDRAIFNHAANVPLPVNPSRTDKVVVLMTDGQNVTHFTPPGVNRVPFINAVDNNHLTEVCNLMKGHYGIIVFSIVFDLPAGPIQNVFRNCATGPEYFFDVPCPPAGCDTNALIPAYTAVAQSIRRLRIRR